MPARPDCLLDRDQPASKRRYKKAYDLDHSAGTAPRRDRNVVGVTPKKVIIVPGKIVNIVV